MKRKILILLLVIGGILVLSSCSDFLNRQPLSKISTDKFWQSKGDVQKGLAGVYATLVPPSVWDIGFGALRTNLDGLSDDAYGAATWPDNFNIVQSGNMTPTSPGIIQTYWKLSYKNIAVCNNFIQNVKKVSFLSKKSKNHYLAQARFMRAWWYFKLERMYGGLVIVPPDITLQQAMLPRSSREETTNYILKDLDFAISHLPAKPYNGHAVKGSARGLKMRVLMHSHQPKKAASVGQKIINAGVFSLVDASHWAGMFNGSFQTGNPEIMFSIVYKPPEMRHEYDRMYGLWGSVEPTHDFVEFFECKDGLPVDKSPLCDPSHPFKNRDPRLNLSVFHPGQRTFKGHKLVKGQYPSNLLIRKGIDRDIVQPNGAYNDNDDIILIRYAGILLLYAQAMNNAYGPSQKAIRAVDRVRTRIGMPPLKGPFTQESLRKAIRYERRAELAFEGIRYFDIQRYHIAKKVITSEIIPGSITEQTPQGIHRTFHMKEYLWPIPRTEIERDPKIKQNPGY